MDEYIKQKCRKCGKEINSTKQFAEINPEPLCVDCGVGKYKTPKLKHKVLNSEKNICLKTWER